MSSELHSTVKALADGSVLVTTTSAEHDLQTRFDDLAGAATQIAILQQQCIAFLLVVPQPYRRQLSELLHDTDKDRTDDPTD